MQYKYPNLCKPITIGKTVFRNRMFGAPMGGTEITADGCIGPRSIKFYELRAYGGAASVTVSECMVHPSDGSHAFRLDLSVPESLPSFTYTADAIKRHGAVPSLELSHSGQFAGTYLADKNKKAGMAQWGPSATVRDDGVEVKELTRDMIDEIVAAFGELAKSPDPKKVMVVGGGPGGLYAAYTAARRGHKVTLCEAADKTGGLLIGEAAIPFKYDMFLLGETYRHLCDKAGVEIRLNTRVDRTYVEKEAPDALIVAAGSEPLIPPIPGLRESPIMFPAEDYHLHKATLGDTVIVLGGGLVGSELAVCLARDGKNVHLVEMRSELCPDANVRYRPLLMNELSKCKVEIHTDCKCEKVDGNSDFFHFSLFKCSLDRPAI